MKDVYAGPLARPQRNTPGDAIGAAIASDFRKAVAAMAHALGQIALDAVEQHPILGILTVLALLFVLLSPRLLRWSAEFRQWFGEHRRRRLEDRLQSPEHIVRALEIDAQREPQQPPKNDESTPDAGSPKSPP